MVYDIVLPTRLNKNKHVISKFAGPIPIICLLADACFVHTAGPAYSPLGSIGSHPPGACLWHASLIGGFNPWQHNIYIYIHTCIIANRHHQELCVKNNQWTHKPDQYSCNDPDAWSSGWHPHICRVVNLHCLWALRPQCTISNIADNGAPSLFHGKISFKWICSPFFQTSGCRFLVFPSQDIAGSCRIIGAGRAPCVSLPQQLTRFHRCCRSARCRLQQLQYLYTFCHMFHVFSRSKHTISYVRHLSPPDPDLGDGSQAIGHVTELQTHGWGEVSCRNVKM